MMGEAGRGWNLHVVSGLVRAWPKPRSSQQRGGLRGCVNEGGEEKAESGGRSSDSSYARVDVPRWPW